MLSNPHACQSTVTAAGAEGPRYAGHPRTVLKAHRVRPPDPRAAEVPSPAMAHARLLMLLAPALLLGCDGDRPRIEKGGARPAKSGEKTATARPVDQDASAKGEPTTAPATAPPSIAPTEPHAFNARDMLAMDRLSDPQPSPDGKSIVFVVRSTDLAANRGRTDLWRVAIAGGTPQRLTDHAESDESPRWAPDASAIYFISKRSGSPQIWKLSPAGGAPLQVTDLPLPVTSLQVSPSGKHLAFSTDVFVDCKDLACTKARLDAAEADKGSGKLYDRLLARHWDSWSDGRRSHLFAIPEGGGTPIDVTAGLDADAPSKPFGGSEEYTFTPDGSAIVFTARDVGRQEAWSTDFDLFVAPIDGSAPPRNLTEANPAWDTHPRLSADGKTLYYKAMARPGYEADRFGLFALDFPAGGAPRAIAGTWDRSIDDLVLAGDGRTALVTADDTGKKPLFAIDLASGDVRTLTEAGSAASPGPAGSKQAVFLRDDLRHPAELFSVPLEGGEATPLTAVNAARVTAARMGEPEPFQFVGAGRDTVHGWIVAPADFDPSKRYPIALLIHGGPQGSFGDHFHYRWNPQAYAGAGYAAIMIDFHGSTGYGQAFTDSIRDDWGGKPFVDLQKGLAAALAAKPWLDGERVCALGASYGGFMINWIAGQWPDRFDCLVNHDGLFDMRAMYYATEELWFPEWEHRGPHFLAPKKYERWNPANAVTKWKTPMLVIHGALDYRVPDTQGLATFTALQRRGIESKLLHFDDENHWVLKPANSLLWHDTVLAWLDQHTSAR